MLLIYLLGPEFELPTPHPTPNSQNHVKPDMASMPMVKCKAETEDSPEPCRPASLMCALGKETLASNKREGEHGHPEVSSDLHTCAVAHVCTITHGHGHT